MDDSGPTAGYIIFFILMLTDILFYGFGAAVKELNTKELSEKAQEGSKKAARLYDIAIKPNKFINTLQFSVTLVNLIMGGYFLENGQQMMQQIIERNIAGGMFGVQLNATLLYILSLVIFGAVLLYIVLTFGILLPKKLGTRYAEKWAYTCITPIYYIMGIFTPLTWLVLITCKGVLKLFGIHGDDNPEDVTEEEIISMVNEGHEQGVLLATEAKMITNIFEFGDKEAQDIMTHRTNILAIEKNITLQEALDYMLSESKSRFPVYDENIDNIIGILHFRDAMRFHRVEGNPQRAVGEIEGLIRDTMFIPETKNIDDLFKDMQQTKTQMVIIVDEYGQTSGLLAMEDILEEIVGNIMDEYDEDEEYIEATENADEYIIEGITPLEELEERLGIIFDEEEFETLNGFLISKLDKIPGEEDENFAVMVGEYEFKVLAVENRMIKSVLVTKVAATEECGEGEHSEEEITKQDKKES